MSDQPTIPDRYQPGRTEAEVTAQIVLPFLERLGITKDELSLETTFTVRIGTKTITANGQETETHTTQRARLDILVSRNGTNLAIIETKSEHHNLTDDDRDQAISYARLVHPIAPFAIVTNGHDWKVYDTISQDEVEEQLQNSTGKRSRRSGSRPPSPASRRPLGRTQDLKNPLAPVLAERPLASGGISVFNRFYYRNVNWKLTILEFLAETGQSGVHNSAARKRQESIASQALAMTKSAERVAYCSKQSETHLTVKSLSLRG